jgi:hypothetical protein
MIPLAPAFLVAAANGLVGLRADGSNRRLMLDLFLRGASQPAGQPWCAAFVHHVGYWSQFDYATNASSWPLPSSPSCHWLGEHARSRRILRETPADGDVFLLWSPMGVCFAHTGVVAHVGALGETPAGRRWFDCDTIEGSTSDDGGRSGGGSAAWRVIRRTRRFYPSAGDRFIRWADLDGRAAVAGGGVQPEWAA